MTEPCWMTRDEVLGREQAVDEWEHGQCAHLGQHRGSKANLNQAIDCVYDYVGSMCERDRGHTGEHAFVSPARITLRFGP